jgi:hypothetical protein
MSNDANRSLIVLAAGIWIVLMAVAIFLAWTADTDVIDALRDAVDYLDDHNDSAGKLIVTLGALVLVVLALLLIIVELAPEDEERELRVEQAGATTIVPALALRQRLEEALVSLPGITAAKARVSTRNKGIATALDVTVTPGTNVGQVTQEATRVVIDTVQTDLGLPVVGVPTVRVAFGGLRPEPVASVAIQAPPPEPSPSPYSPPLDATPEPALGAVETVDERVEAAALMGGADGAPPSEPPVVDPLEGPADDSGRQPPP